MSFAGCMPRLAITGPPWWSAACDLRCIFRVKQLTLPCAAPQVMRKVCSHPGLALNLSDPGHAKAAREALGTCDPTAVAAALRDVAQSPKLMALKELLVDCGIGVASEEQGQEVGRWTWLAPPRDPQPWVDMQGRNCSTKSTRRP